MVRGRRPTSYIDEELPSIALHVRTAAHGRSPNKVIINQSSTVQNSIQRSSLQVRPLDSGLGRLSAVTLVTQDGRAKAGHLAEHGGAAVEPGAILPSKREGDSTAPRTPLASPHACTPRPRPGLKGVGGQLDRPLVTRRAVALTIRYTAIAPSAAQHRLRQGAPRRLMPPLPHRIPHRIPRRIARWIARWIPH